MLWTDPAKEVVALTKPCRVRAAELLLVLAVFLLFASLPLSASAPSPSFEEPEEAAQTLNGDDGKISPYSPAVFLRSDAVVETPSPLPAGSHYLDESFAGNWSFSGDVRRAAKQNADALSILQVSLQNREPFSGYALLQHTASYNLSRYDTLSFRIRLMSSELSQNDAQNYGKITVELSGGGGTETYYSVVYVVPDQWQTVTVDISPCRSVNAISIHVAYGAVPRRIQITSPWSGSNRLFHAMTERYQTPALEAENGRLRQSSDGYTVFYPEDRIASLSGRLSLDTEPTAGQTGMLCVTLSGASTEGTLSAGFRDLSGAWTDTVSLPLENGLHLYPFPFTVPEGLVAYRLVFRGAVVESGGIGIESVSFQWSGQNDAALSGLGYVANVSYQQDTGELLVSGNVAQSALSEHIRDELVLYAIPYEYYTAESYPDAVLSAESLGGTELMRSRISMNFDLTLSAAITARYIGTHMFYVTLEHADGTGKMLVSLPKGVDGAVNNLGEMSIIGIDGASAVGVFESNSTHAVIDVPFDTLIRRIDREEMDEEARTAPSIAGQVRISTGNSANPVYLYLDEDLLNTLIAEISFYDSARIEVYLRVTDSALVSPARVIAMDDGDLAVYSAVLTYLLRQSGEVSGVIMGRPVSYVPEMFSDISVFQYARSFAKLMRVTYSLAVPYVDPDKFCVVMPYLAPGLWNGAVNQAISLALEQLGNIPWSLLYCFDSDNAGRSTFIQTAKAADNLIENTAVFGIRTAASLMLRYEPVEISEEGDLTALSSDFELLCEVAEPYTPRAIFIAVNNLRDNRKETFYRLMKYIRPEDKNSKIADFSAFHTPSGEAEPYGTYTLWDFQNAYYTDGWVSGGTVSACGTGWSGIFSEENGGYSRVLRTPVYAGFESGTASEIILRNFSRRIDLTGVSKVRFRFAVTESGEKETPSPATVIFILGNNTSRAEYYLYDVEPGKVQTVLCSLEEYRDPVSYLGIMVYADDASVLELESVRFESDTLTGDELRLLFYPVAEEEASAGFTPLLLLFVVAVISLCLLALTIRRDREDAPPPKEKRPG